MALKKKDGMEAGTVVVETAAAVQEPVTTTAPVAELVQEPAAQTAANPTFGAAVAAPAAPATPAPPAVQQQHAVAVSRNPMPSGLILDEVKDKLVMDFGTLPRLKASNNNVIDDKDRLLGDYVDVQIVSWNHQFVVGPCDNKAPAELVKYSADNQTFDDGTGLTVTDWVNELKAQGYPGACSKMYGEVVAMLFGSAKPTELVGQLVQIQMSPTSLKAFDGFRLQQTFRISQGMADPESASLVRFAVEVITSRGNTWSRFSPIAIPVAA